MVEYGIRWICRKTMKAGITIVESACRESVHQGHCYLPWKDFTYLGDVPQLSILS